jgi:hypothetical protein
MADDRDRSLRVQVSTAELKMLHEIAEADGITASDVIRMFVRRAHAERFGDKKPGGRRAK